jgi:hypothetical protein
MTDKACWRVQELDGEGAVCQTRRRRYVMQWGPMQAHERRMHSLMSDLTQAHLALVLRVRPLLSQLPEYHCKLSNTSSTH